MYNTVKLIGWVRAIFSIPFSSGRGLPSSRYCDYPLFLVGADYNQAALKVTRANLIKADIWAKFIWGDIGHPDLLNSDLQENYNIDLKDLLNVLKMEIMKTGDYLVIQ